jgi:hypothetical protein
MEAFFTNMGTWIIHLSPWMIFSLVLIIVMAYIFKTPLSEKITKMRFKDLKFWGKEEPTIQLETRDIKTLINHDIFNTCNRVKLEMKFIKFYTDKEFDTSKTKMCQDFVIFKSDICADSFKLFIQQDLAVLTTDSLKTLVLTEMNKMHIDYISAIKNHWLQKGIDLEDVEYIVELFEKFRWDVVVSFGHRVEAIFSSSFHKSNYDKILAVYDMYAMGIDLLPKDIQTTFEALNGKFKNIEY